MEPAEQKMMAIEKAGLPRGVAGGSGFTHRAIPFSFCRWLLAVGYWLLAIGFWLLAGGMATRRAAVVRQT
jgi:hypothetical protein